MVNTPLVTTFVIVENQDHCPLVLNVSTLQNFLVRLAAHVNGVRLMAPYGMKMRMTPMPSLRLHVRYPVGAGYKSVMTGWKRLALKRYYERVPLRSCSIMSG